MSRSGSHLRIQHSGLDVFHGSNSAYTGTPSRMIVPLEGWVKEVSMAAGRSAAVSSAVGEGPSPKLLGITL